MELRFAIKIPNTAKSNLRLTYFILIDYNCAFLLFPYSNKLHKFIPIMSILEINVYPDPILKRVAKKIIDIDDSIKQLAKDMFETMYQAPGVGLAAPQVGHSISLVVADPASNDDPPNPMVLVNPTIIAGEGETTIVEGCLSVPGFSAEISRYQKIVIRALTLDAEELELTLEDFPAIVIQHEIDHLQGKLFIDRISRLKRNIFERKLKKGTLA